MKTILERLNFFNGQRLEAVDLRAEQDYHITVRRELNRRLYSPGIASGLEVEMTADKQHIRIMPGLALDHEGKEIILLVPRIIPVCGLPSTASGIVFGNFVVIQYDETKMAPVMDSCIGAVSAKQNGKESAWGAPSRIRAEPVLQIQDTWPADSSGKIVLAQLELDKNCKVVDVRRNVRKYVVAAKPPIVKAISLEGEKDIDKHNDKTIFFHIEGGFPESVKLYLRASRFSSLFYTEMGRHTHQVSATSAPKSHDFAHAHDAGNATTDPAGKHTHGIKVDDGEDAPGVDVDNPDGINFHIIMEAPDHVHTIKGFSVSSALGVWEHDHAIAAVASPEGAADENAISGQPTKKFVDDLQVIFDGTQDLTQEILGILRSKEGAIGASEWKKLGDGSAGHRLVTQGTGPIELTKFGVSLVPGEHSITLRVGAGGGQIHFNLYVE